jgi:hypothetical protein
MVSGVASDELSETVDHAASAWAAALDSQSVWASGLPEVSQSV